MILKDDEIRFAERYKAITENHEYQKLKDVPRHGSTNTFDHSVRVAMMASSLAPYVGVDRESAARVGLLHDFCLVDYHIVDKTIHDGRWYCFYHPEDAVVNAEKEGFYLSFKEKRAIWSHMFPLSTSIPTSRLGCILTLSDKLVALQESMANAAVGWAHLCLLFHRGRLRVVRVVRVVHPDPHDLTK